MPERLEVAPALTLELLSPIGKLVRTLEINQQIDQFPLDLAGLSAGIYFVLLRNKDSIGRGSFIKID
jgi:hypothetical protein